MPSRRVGSAHSLDSPITSTCPRCTAGNPPPSRIPRCQVPQQQIALDPLVGWVHEEQGPWHLSTACEAVTAERESGWEPLSRLCSSRSARLSYAWVRPSWWAGFSLENPYALSQTYDPWRKAASSQWPIVQALPGPLSACRSPQTCFRCRARTGRLPHCISWG